MKDVALKKITDVRHSHEGSFQDRVLPIAFSVVATSGHQTDAASTPSHRPQEKRHPPNTNERKPRTEKKSPMNTADDGPYSRDTANPPGRAPIERFMERSTHSMEHHDIPRDVAGRIAGDGFVEVAPASGGGGGHKARSTPDAVQVWSRETINTGHESDIEKKCAPTTKAATQPGRIREQ